MTITEAQRFQLHLGLRTMMGDDMANTLMEHLPPMGWGDVARRSDVDLINKRIDALEHRLDKRIDGVVAGLWALAAITCAGFIGMFALIATKF